MTSRIGTFCRTNARLVVHPFVGRDAVHVYSEELEIHYFWRNQLPAELAYHGLLCSLQDIAHLLQLGSGNEAKTAKAIHIGRIGPSDWPYVESPSSGWLNLRRCWWGRVGRKLCTKNWRRALARHARGQLHSPLERAHKGLADRQPCGGGQNSASARRAVPLQIQR